MKCRMLGVLAAAVASFFLVGVPAANADIIEYKVTGVGPDLGTNFTFVSTDGFVTASSFPLVPTTATDLFVGGVDEGAITSVVITDAGQQLEYIATGGDFIFVSNLGGVNFPTAPGTFTDAVGSTLTGTGVVTDLSTVPEPGSISLVLTGLLSLGLMMVIRMRAARHLP